MNRMKNTFENVPVSQQDVDSIIALLDNYVVSGKSRLKIQTVEGNGEVIDYQYHHGRCDINSPWAKGTAFDVLED